MAILTGHGFAVEPPPGWEGRIYRRAVPGVLAARTVAARIGARPVEARPVAAGMHVADEQVEQQLPVVHLANFPLPADRGDYGSGAVEMMRARHSFVALLEFGSECLGSALFRAARPRVSADRFDPNGLQRRLPGLRGAQYFFTEKERPMCLYVVLGERAPAAPVNEVLDRVRMTA